MSPYKLPDHGALPTPPERVDLPIPDPASVETGLSDQEKIPTLTASIEALTRPILDAREAAKAAAQAAVESAPEYPIIRGVGPAVRTIFQESEPKLAAVGKDKNLSAKGRNDAEAKLTAALDAKLDHIGQVVVSEQGDSLLRRFPEPSFRAAPTDVIAECGLYIDSYRIKAASTVLFDGIGFVRRAIDPATSPNEAFRLNLNLHHAVGPVIERMALAPPKYAVHLQSLYGELSALIRLHLESTLRVDEHAIAVDFVARAREAFSWLVYQAKANGWDDFIFLPLAEVFKWD